MNISKNGIFLSLIFGLLGLFIDRAHKFYQINMMGWTGGEYVNATSFFDYILIWNRGASFGMFASLPPIFLYMIIGTALIIIIVWWLTANDVLTRLGLALILSGAISNIIDRMLYSAVADFFHFYIGQYSFYIFNIADTLIFIGVVLLLLEMVIPKKQNQEQPK